MIWHTNLYDNKHDFVSKYGEDVIELLAPQAGELILDMGCGTGDLAALIKQKGATVIGFDKSIDMIETARKKYPHIQFDVKAADDFEYDTKFDAVFSNATLHWVLDYQKAIDQIYNALKTGGRFVAEFGGKGNVFNIVNGLKFALRKRGYANNADKPVWYFPSLSEYTCLLEKTGFRVTFAAHFDRNTLLKDDDGIKNWLRQFAQPFLQKIPDEIIEEIMTDVEEQVRSTNYKNGHWYADYVRLRIVAIKTNIGAGNE